MMKQFYLTHRSEGVLYILVSSRIGTSQQNDGNELLINEGKSVWVLLFQMYVFANPSAWVECDTRSIFMLG